MNHFDILKNKPFDAVTHLMGYDAIWTNSVSGEILTARVAYKDPSEKQELSGIDSWNPSEPFMEYRKGFFTGLKDLVDSNVFQKVTIDTKGIFYIREIQTKFDGDTFVARLSKEI